MSCKARYQLSPSLCSVSPPIGQVASDEILACPWPCFRKCLIASIPMHLPQERIAPNDQIGLANASMNHMDPVMRRICMLPSPIFALLVPVIFLLLSAPWYRQTVNVFGHVMTALTRSKSTGITFAQRSAWPSTCLILLWILVLVSSHGSAAADPIIQKPTNPPVQGYPCTKHDDCKYRGCADVPCTASSWPPPGGGGVGHNSNQACINGT